MSVSTRYKVSIGLETHVQLKTRSKIWCACPNVFGSSPNTDVCPICLGYPGTMPVLNEEAVKLTVCAGLLLGSRINHYSKFDRKSYFYPDMPKNYQISQYDQPFCTGGEVSIEVNGKTKTIRIHRIHLEEDVAKNNHFETASGVDFNRAGTPLMEIVSEPDMESADEAFAYLQALKQMLVYGGITDGNLEQGNIRCDINCSVRPDTQTELGTKTEIKNMNTFKGVHRSLTYEIERQIAVCEQGGKIVQETRRWDDARGMTTAMRSKEYAHDYRYFPEPDLMPVVLEDAQIEAWRAGLPEMPQARRARFIADFGLPAYDAGVLVADKAVADFFEATLEAGANPKAASNWVMTELLRMLGEQEMSLDAAPITPPMLAGILQLLDEGKINNPAAKTIFAVCFAEGGDPREIMEHRGLAQVSDDSALDTWVQAAITDNPKSVADYQAGKKAALQFLMGQVMRASKGKANPPKVMAALKAQLDR